MGMKKYQNIWLKIIGIALFHFLLSVILTLKSFTSGLTRFDNGNPPSQSEQIIDFGLQILNFPLVSLALSNSLLSKFFSGFLGGFGGWLVFLLNSLLWGVGIYLFGLFLCKKFRPN